MNTTGNIRTKKFREKKKLELLNKELKDKDILRGEKKTSKRDEVLLREDLKLKTNEPKIRFKRYISKLIRHYYSDAECCYFFTVCYPHDDNTGMVANITVMDALKEHLLKIGAVATMIAIPEYHKTRYAIHNHGIIRVNKDFAGDFKTELKRYWVASQNGSVYTTQLNADKEFETYLTKFVSADESRLYNFSDCLVTVGINFNAVPEIRIGKTSLVPVIVNTHADLQLAVGCNNEAVDELVTSNDLKDRDTTIGTKLTDLPEQQQLPKAPIKEDRGFAGFYKRIGRQRRNKAAKGLKLTRRATEKLYKWCSLLIVAYFHFIMRL